MSIATANQTINWCPPIHRTITPSTDPASVTLPPGFVVLITGSSRGIGLATAISYAKAGASSILLTGRDQKSLEAARQAVVGAAKQAGKVEDVHVEACVGDVCSEEDIRRLASSIKDKFGKLDALILNAGKANGLVQGADGKRDWPHDVTALDLPDFRQTFEVNFFAGVVAVKYLIPLLDAAGPESVQSIIWVTSSSIHHYDPKLMAMGYSLSKFTAARFVEYVHEAHQESGITVFGIQPGSVMTDMGKYELPEGKGWEKSACPTPYLANAFS
jgi:NAD(P)-dependent dehydrogenase (short-subunit alcohol dehydrogenase family)